MEPRKFEIGRGLLWGAALSMLALSGCFTTNTPASGTQMGACPMPTTQFDIARQTVNGACAPAAAGAAAGASCNSAADCAANCCSTTSVQLCVDHMCQSAAAACACASQAPAMAGATSGTCNGDSMQSSPTPRGGAANGATCSSSLDCGEVSCGCPAGAPGYYAAACINGKCDSTQACSCVSAQFQASFGHDVCGSATGGGAGGGSGTPTTGSTCSGESGSAGSSPKGGTPVGGACSDSKQCAEVTCPCSGNNGYYAAACTNGVCDISTACACVATAYQKQFGKDVCSAAGPVSSPPAPVQSCDGAASSSKGARTAGNSGATCKTSADCTQAICGCPNGKSYYAASCVNGQCDNTNACACVQQQYQTTFGKDVCSG